MKIPSFAADADETEIHDALGEFGCVVVNDLLASTKRDDIVAELHQAEVPDPVHLQ